MAALLLLCGCAVKGPQTADELRRAVASAKTETFEVRRRHRDVAESLQRHAGKCLNGRDYKPTLVVSARKAELHVHREDPADAHYVLVADAWPAPRGRTSVQLFTYNGYDGLAAAVRAWASGKEAQCPDLSRRP